MAQTGTGISKSKIKIELGNSDLPPAPSQGGSTGLSSISGAVNAAVKALKLKLASYAALQNEIYKTTVADDIILNDNGIAFKTNNNQFITYSDCGKKINSQPLKWKQVRGRVLKDNNMLSVLQLRISA
jgi:xanthine dehydrogenase YagR molybdenum-binding subunit